MANVSKPNGLTPVKHLNGSPWNGQANLYYIPASDTNAYFLGDAVRSAVGGDDKTGTPAVQLFGTRNAASTTGSLRGVVVGIGTAVSTSGGELVGNFDPDNLNTLSIPATKTKDYYVWVADAVDTVFEAQSNTLAVASYNKNCPLFVANAPTAPVSVSASFAQTSAAAATAALPLRIIGAPNRPDNELASPATDAKVWVVINQHELSGSTAGV